MAADVPKEHALKVGLLMRLATNWKWLAATGIDAMAFGVEAIALGLGSLVVVQAVLPSTLLFALPLGAMVGGGRLSRNEWIAAFAVAGGIALFLFAASPTAGSSQAPTRVWIALLTFAATIVGLLAFTGARSELAPVKAGCWASAGAILYAVLSALTKSTVDLLGSGIGTVLSSWQPYVAGLCALSGTLLIQSAFQSGSLSTSLPLMLMIEPISGVLIGSFVFLERLNHGPLHLAAMAAALTAMLCGVVTLSKSPLAAYMA